MPWKLHRNHPMTRPSIGSAAMLSAILLLPSAGTSVKGTERGDEATAIRADEIVSTAPASSWVPQWFPKAPVLPLLTWATWPS